MLTFSGFGWDEACGMPTADNDVWQRYIEANPKAKEFRFKPFKYYNELRDVFTGMSATGADAVPPSQLTLLLNGSDDDEPVNVSSVRKRPNSFSSEDETTSSSTQHSRSAMKGINKRKRIRSQPLKQSAGKSIAEALLEVGNRATALSGQDKSERAVEVVLEEYETLPLPKKLRLLQLLENNMKATHFLRMGPGELRDSWVDFQLGEESVDSE